MTDSFSDRMVAGSWILEQLTLELPDVEMAEGRRAWHEAESAWPGEEPQLWWKWLAEAATSIGLQTKTIDCTVAEAAALVSNGVQIVTHQPSEHGDGLWLRARPAGTRRVEIQTTQDVGTTEVIKLRRVMHSLRRFELDGRIRCVVIRGDLSSNIEESKALKPLSRLQRLLRPEWSDIWIVMVFAFIVGILTLATPIAVEALVNTVAFGSVVQPIFVLALILLTFLSFSAALRALQTYVVELVQRRLFARVAGDLAFRLPRAETSATEGIYLPELTNRFFDIVTVQKVAASLLLDGIDLILSAVVGMAVLAFYHPWLFGFDIVLMALIAFIILVLGQGAIGTAIKESKNKYYMASWLEDIARCPTVFRTSGGTDLALERTDRLVHEYLEARQKHFRILMRQIVFALGLQAVASTALLGIGGWLVVDNQLTLGQLVAAELIVTVIVRAFAKMGKHMESFYDLLASVDKLGSLFDLPTEHHDGMMEMHASGPVNLDLDAVELSRSSGGMHLRGSVSFKAPPRSSVALLGGSGSGKSALMDLMYGLRAPTAGHVTIDGFDPQDLRSDVLRANVSLVRQAEIFHGTLEENVHLHRATVTSADVRMALEDVGLYNRVLKLSKSFDTPLRGNGAPLSGTQVELLCLARAIVDKPRLLLIDGVLDSLSDGELESVLEKLLHPERPWTLVIGTGKKSVADRCDEIVRLYSEYSSAQDTATEEAAS